MLTVFLIFTQVRSWWNLSDKKTANVVEKFTSTNVTPALWNSEVRRIQETKASFDNMTVILGRPTLYLPTYNKL